MDHLNLPYTRLCASPLFSGPLHDCRALCVALVLTGWAFQYKCKSNFRGKWNDVSFQENKQRPSCHCKFWQSLKEIVKKIRFEMKHVIG